MLCAVSRSFRHAAEGRSYSATGLQNPLDPDNREKMIRDVITGPFGPNFRHRFYFSEQSKSALLKINVFPSQIFELAAPHRCVQCKNGCTPDNLPVGIDPSPEVLNTACSV